MKSKRKTPRKSEKEVSSKFPQLQKTISRRSLLVGAATLGAGSGFLNAAPRTAAAGPPASGPRVVALVGDRYHNPDYIRVSLDRLFSGLDLPVDYTIRYDQLSRDLLRGYRILVCFRDGMIWPGGYLGPDAYGYERELENPGEFPREKAQNWISQQQAEAVRDFVAEGNGLYCLHNSSHISLSSPIYREVMGGAYIGHPPLRPFKVRVSNSNHPITRGIEDFMVNDEQHYVAYDKDPQNILLQAENIDGLGYEDHGTKSISGWAHEYGKGRVVFTAVGHTIHAIWAPQYLKLQKRAVQWLLKTI
ncbi:MAG TPA: ThuA domain-containing protein [Terriglobia bacterium]|nr:ThuA domain-containing protein [Terriglobia bacterium]